VHKKTCRSGRHGASNAKAKCRKLICRYCLKRTSFRESRDNSIHDYGSILSEKEFEIIKLMYISEMPVSEIARQKNISIQAVYQIRNRALQKLRMSKYFEET